MSIFFGLVEDGFDGVEGGEYAGGGGGGEG